MPFPKKSRRGMHFKTSQTSNIDGSSKNRDHSVTTEDLLAERCTNTVSDLTLETNEDLPELEIEYVRMPGQHDPNIRNITGRRIVDIDHFLNAVRGLESHTCRIDPRGYFGYKNEIQFGLHSKLMFECTYCKEVTSITTNKSEPDVNLLAAWGAIANGKSHYFLEEAMSLLDVPPLSNKLFLKCQAQLGSIWLDALTLSIQQAGKEEYEFAIQNGSVIEGPNGKIGLCTVIVDGGWSHRSYGHRYTAKSGVACIIGKETKKLLFIGIRNKYCGICAIAKNRQTNIPHHKCYKNWEGSSTAMEADIIVEGFMQSEAMHNLHYTTFIGDGDSSVHTSILEHVPYSRKISKVECANHITKNLTKHLFELAKESASNKKLLSSARISLIAKSCRKLISIHSKKPNPSPQLLQSDIKNVANHAFSDHSGCTKDSCLKAGQKGENVLKKASTQTQLRISTILGTVSARALSLISNSTSNRAEQFMRQVAKWNASKSTFYGRRNAFEIRCYGAGLSYQYGPNWITKVYKTKFGRSPPKILSRLRNKRLTKKSKTVYRKRLSFKDGKAATIKRDYGASCHKPDLPNEEVKKLIQDQVTILHASTKLQKEIEESTRGQSSNPAWFEARKSRLTASIFGQICKRKKNHGKLVNEILYKVPPNTKAIEYGKLNEAVAINAYAELTENVVRACGFFVCTEDELGFLGATPDGLVGSDKIIEVKCPYSARELTPLEACEKLKNFYCTLADDKNSMKLKKTHNYYYQIQGQLHISKKKFCDFVVWTPKGIHCETIEFDKKFIETMNEKLKDFFYNHFAVEIVDSRHERSMPVRNS